MGVDLRLLPFDADNGSDFAYSHTILEVGRDYDLHDKIKKLPSLPVPSGFTSFSGKQEGFDDTCYGLTIKTPYGEELKYVVARDLCAIELRKDAHNKLRGVWAYLSHLPPLTKVALYWH
jgi:hypothetical protein